MDKSKNAQQIFDSMKKGFGRFYKKAKEESNSEQSKIDYELERIKTIRKDNKRYSQARLHAQGGMKSIIRSTDRLTCRQIAIAKMKSEKYSATDLKMFLHEARILARLNHPNIVPIHDIGVDANDQPYFTMKLLSGESLGIILDKIRAKEEEYVAKYPLPRLLEIYLKVCDATSFAHSRNIVHRDLKPDNVQVSEFGEVLLCDWGLAKDINLPNQSTEEIKISEIIERQTLNGTIKGTPGYMAPEQVDELAEITEKTDIYALGCILYSILTLEKSIESSDLDTIVDSIRSGAITPPHLRVSANVPKALEAVTLKAMSVNPDERYDSPNEIASEIKAYLDGFATDAQNADFKTQIILLIKRNKTSCLLILASFLIISVLISYFLIELKKREAMALNAMKEAQYQKSEKDKLGRSVAPDFYKKATEAIRYYNFEQALNFAQLSTVLDNNFSEGWTLLGKLQLGQHNFTGAIVSLKKAKNPTAEKIILIALELIEAKSPNLETISMLIKNQHTTSIVPFYLKNLYQKTSESKSYKLAIELFNQYHQFPGPPFATLNEEAKSLNITKSRKLIPKSLDIFHGLSLKYLDLSNIPLTPLYTFSSMPIVDLNLSRSLITDINFVKGMPLERLNISRSKITDLSPIRNHPIQKLNISKTKIKNLNILLELEKLKSLTISQLYNDKKSIIQFLKKRGVEIIISE